MYDFVKRFVIAVIMMFFIGMMIIGSKTIHAEDKENGFGSMHEVVKKPSVADQQKAGFVPAFY
jgi:hypothetical protein